MKKLTSKFPVIVFLIIFSSCTQSINYELEKEHIITLKEIIYYKNIPFTGEMLTDNNLYGKTKANYKNGKKDGLSEIYYENGQLKQKENYKDGALDGLSEIYYENGQLEHKANYKKGLLDGLSETYYENGQLSFKQNYKNDQYDGLVEAYNKNGQLLARKYFKNGKLVD